MAKTLASFQTERARIKDDYLAGLMDAQEFATELELLKAEESFHVMAVSTHILCNTFGRNCTTFDK